MYTQCKWKIRDNAQGCIVHDLSQYTKKPCHSSINQRRTNIQIFYWFTNRYRLVVKIPYLQVIEIVCSPVISIPFFFFHTNYYLTQFLFIRLHHQKIILCFYCAVVLVSRLYDKCIFFAANVYYIQLLTGTIILANLSWSIMRNRCQWEHMGTN